MNFNSIEDLNEDEILEIYDHELKHTVYAIAEWCRGCFEDWDNGGGTAHGAMYADACLNGARSRMQTYCNHTIANDGKYNATYLYTKPNMELGRFTCYSDKYPYPAYGRSNQHLSVICTR